MEIRKEKNGKKNKQAKNTKEKYETSR
jgi:hypothetical protein